MTTAPHARILLFSFNLHIERSPLVLKIKKILGIYFQLFSPNFVPVSHVTIPKFLEFGEGEEDRME